MTDTEAFKALCAEAKDLMKRLEGSSVSKVTVELDDAKIEVERGAGAGRSCRRGRRRRRVRQRRRSARRHGHLARGARRLRLVRGDRRESTTASPVLAPLVGTFYEAAGAGREGRSSRSARPSRRGETVCIVEAMKLMNEVAASEGGKVAEIVVDQRRAGRVRAGADVPRAGRGLDVRESPDREPRGDRPAGRPRLPRARHQDRRGVLHRRRRLRRRALRRRGRARSARRPRRAPTSTSRS